MEDGAFAALTVVSAVSIEISLYPRQQGVVDGNSPTYTLCWQQNSRSNARGTSKKITVTLNLFEMGT